MARPDCGQTSPQINWTCVQKKKKTFPHGSRAANESEANFVSLAGEGEGEGTGSYTIFTWFFQCFQYAHKSFVCWFKSIHLPYKQSAAAAAARGNSTRLDPTLTFRRPHQTWSWSRPAAFRCDCSALPFNAFQCVIINIHGHGYTTTWHLNDLMQSTGAQSFPQLWDWNWATFGADYNIELSYKICNICCNIIIYPINS